jgi:hypothetical protein
LLTYYWDRTLADAGKSGNTLELEFGRSSYLDGKSLVYVIVDGRTLILDEASGRKLCEAMDGLSSYLGYNR